MLFILGNKVNTYRLITFDHASSSDHMLFQEGKSLKGMEMFLSYQIESSAALSKLRKVNLIHSTGPELVSAELRKALEEEEEAGKVEFFDAYIACDDERLDSFFAMNVTHRVPCMDMDLSEFTITNFDPSNPVYDFDYQVLRSEFDHGINIATCDEMPVSTVVNDVILGRIKSHKIKGLVLSSSIDMTMKDRSVRIST